MAQGFEGAIVIKEQPNGWGSTTVNPLGIQFAEAESSDLDIGIVQNRRNNKIRNSRFMTPGLVTNDFANPSGGFTLQPRAVEMLPLLMAHYQVVSVKGGSYATSAGTFFGTFHFAAANKTPDAVGSVWGTWNNADYTYNAQDYYPLTIISGFGTLENTAPVGQTVFQHGIVNTMQWRQAFDSDLIVTSNLVFKGKAPGVENLAGSGNFGTNFTPSTLRYSGWTATITVDGTANTNLDIEEWGFTSDAKGQGRGRIGQYGFGRFTYADNEEVGNFRVEFKDYALYRKVLNGSLFALVMRWQISGQSDWIEINQYNCRFRPVTPNLPGGDQVIDLNYEYEAFGTNGTPSTMVSVFAYYGTQLLSLDLTAGSARAA